MFECSNVRMFECLNVGMFRVETTRTTGKKQTGRAR
jgi:hypothetical protein